ncbi:four-carbon acid sugar kinase family protein [Olivibacter sp. XZL3]|uniref:four-carbon acid sugar kinase family protein n=1 Tax=Olivibacter sp. XZL3 TaxID=1735116 RepID=UPI0010649F3A|nr:four-carbon acid sugar kinase family protein [Olivibacter sp. XZL3]
MIIVIADDLTGAAELGGIGLRYNLRVEIANQIGVAFSTETDLLVININTRSMIEAAMEQLSRALKWIEQLPYSFLFKKVDSVLRGHVTAEINMQLVNTHMKRALLLPANPRLGRIIKNGKYYVQGQEIHETHFSKDPEFPIKNADVLHMLGAGEEVQVMAWRDIFPEEGIVVGEVLTEEDVEKWIQLVPDDVLLAGGSSAFIAFLTQKIAGQGFQKEDASDTFSGFNRPCLYVCGSNYEKSVQRVQAWRMANEPVCYLPIVQPGEKMNGQLLNNWIERVKAAIACHQKAIVAFDNEGLRGLSLTPCFLREQMAQAVHNLLNEVFVRELVIEGGATADAILAQRHITQLKPLEELGPGVIRCNMHKDPEIWITLKPGSYSWFIL